MGTGMKPNDLPKTLRRYARRIAYISDERASGDGYWVGLASGWKSDSDPIGCLHGIHEDTISECARQVRTALPCDCKDCKTEEPA